MFKHGFPPEWSTLKKLIWLVGSGIAGASYIWKTVTGTLIHITDALASPVQALSVAIEPQQSGSGDPSPDNVRPITGWTGCNIRRTGKNLFDKTNISENNRYIRSDGSFVSNSSWVVSSYIHVKAGETYTLSNYQNSNTSAPGVKYYGNDGDIVGFAYGRTRTKTFTVPNGALTMRISVMASLIDSCQLELGSTATTHEDYQGTTYPISWQTEAGTVYGGTLDAVNGTLTVTKATKTFDENDDWGITGSVFYINNSLNDFIVGDTYHPPYFICNKYEFQKYVSSSSSAKDDGVYTNAHNTYGKRIFVRDSNYSTVDAFKASLVGSPITVCCELVEPIEYTLTPQQISTLAGENNIWADVNGDITLEYLAQG